MSVPIVAPPDIQKAELLVFFQYEELGLRGFMNFNRSMSGFCANELVLINVATLIRTMNNNLDLCIFILLVLQAIFPIAHFFYY